MTHVNVKLLRCANWHLILLILILKIKNVIVLDEISYMYQSVTY